MKVSDKLYINLDVEQIDDRVLDELTYRNPEYFQKMNLGISVYGVPKEIKTYEIVERELRVPRGDVLKIKPFFMTPYQPEFSHPDHPIKLQYINNDFDLDQHQAGAVAAMQQYRQGIVHAVTSAGKSLIILKAAVDVGQKTLVVVHRKILMQQILEDIDKYIRDENGQKINPGIIGDGKFSVGDITIGIDKSLTKRLPAIRESFGMVVLDECHLCPAKTISNLINSINSRSRFGLSGTLKRKDQKEFLIYSTFGKVISTIGKEVLLKAGRVVPVEVKIIESETRFDWDQVVTALTDLGEKNPTMKARQLQEQAIAGDPGRNAQILDQVKTLHKAGGKTIIVSRYVKPCYELQEELLSRYRIKSGVITGKNTKEALKSYNDMKHGDSQTIFATIGCVSTGVSISDLDDLVLISPVYNNELLLHQLRGRLMRKAKGKTVGTLWFIYDQHIFNDRKLKNFLAIMRK